MANQNQTGFRRILNAAGYSASGLGYAVRNESAFRQELILSLVMIPAAFWVGSNGVERALLIGSCLLVLITELLNSAIEAVVDRVGEEHHELSGRAKDMASAAVFIGLWTSGIIWALIGYDRLFS